MDYVLYYWPGIPGRGEFVRLVLEAGQARYRDIGLEPDGVEQIETFMNGEAGLQMPFAAPFLLAENQVISHVANILRFLGPKLGLTSDDVVSRDWEHSLQLTIADFVTEIHDTHHPLGPSLYFEEQKTESIRRTATFLQERLPLFLDYFEQILAANPASHHHLVNNRLTCVDISLFHVLEGLRYAFPRTMHTLDDTLPNTNALHANVMACASLKAYMNSERRQPFNENGLFRHYPILDQP